jgi:hypothetical protein
LAIFCEKIGVFFSKTNVMIKILDNLALFWVKTPFFRRIFLRKYSKNHNIGPWSPRIRAQIAIRKHLVFQNRALYFLLQRISMPLRPGLPDFSWYKIPKLEKYTKLPRTIPNVYKI